MTQVENRMTISRTSWAPPPKGDGNSTHVETLAGRVDRNDCEGGHLRLDGELVLDALKFSVTRIDRTNRYVVWGSVLWVIGRNDCMGIVAKHNAGTTHDMTVVLAGSGHKQRIVGEFTRAWLEVRDVAENGTRVELFFEFKGESDGLK